MSIKESEWINYLKSFFTELHHEGDDQEFFESITSWEFIFLTNLKIESNQVAAFDPFQYIAWYPSPFFEKVKQGSYPVYLSLIESDDQVIGKSTIFAVLMFSEEVPKILKPAFLDDDKNDFSHSVASSISCFSDNRILQFLNEHEVEDYEEFTENLLSLIKNNQTSKTWCWANLSLPEFEANMICFSTTLGNGAFRSYWGYSEMNKLICLITCLY
jgi:hypothetical protein